MPRAGLDSETVVEAAQRIADAEGLEALTLARLAAELGVRSPSLYVHVGGLEDLRRRVGERGARELAGALGAAAAGRARGDALFAVARAYRTYAREHPGVYAALQRAPEPSDERGRSAAAAVVEIVVAVLRGYGLAGDEEIHAARAVRAALHGFVALELGGGFGIKLSLEDSYEFLLRAIDRGLQD
jgi:AcrR family transcriptional regulator